MSRVRTGPDPALVAAYEKGRCRFCLGPVAPPRRTFCSDACVDEWKLQTDGKFRRQKVFARDRGVCNACGRDCHALEAALLKLLYENPSQLDEELGRLKLTRRIFSGPTEHLPPDVRKRLDWLAGRKRDAELETWTPGKTLWEADHVLEVIDGGGSCTLSNLATLCLWCHRVKTAANRKRRAELRKDTFPSPELFELEDAAYPPDELFED